MITQTADINTYPRCSVDHGHQHGFRLQQRLRPLHGLLWWLGLQTSPATVGLTMEESLLMCLKFSHNILPLSHAFSALSLCSGVITVPIATCYGKTMALKLGPSSTAKDLIIGQISQLSDSQKEVPIKNKENNPTEYSWGVNSPEQLEYPVHSLELFLHSYINCDCSWACRHGLESENCTAGPRWHPLPLGWSHALPLPVAL